MAMAFSMYYNDYNAFPAASRNPLYPDVNLNSNPPGQLLPSIVTLLGPYCENNSKVFQCPMDVSGGPYTDPTDGSIIPGAPGTQSWYLSTSVNGIGGTSYEWHPRVNGKTYAQLESSKYYSLLSVWLMYDFLPVHGPVGAASNRCFLYADGHVE
jgi:hypothetical protein